MMSMHEALAALAAVVAIGLVVVLLGLGVQWWEEQRSERAQAAAIRRYLRQQR